MHTYIHGICTAAVCSMQHDDTRTTASIVSLVHACVAVDMACECACLRVCDIVNDCGWRVCGDGSDVVSALCMCDDCA